MAMECGVSFEPVPTITGTATWSATACHSANFSSSVSTALSPVEPVSTSPSLPCATSHLASSTATPRSSAPSSSNGVTMAVITRPKRGASRAGLIAPSRYQRVVGPPGLSHVALGGRPVGERVLVFGGVREVLEGDRAHVGELLAQPPVRCVEQAELLEVRDDLGEQEDLEVVLLGRRLHDLDDVADRHLHALPHLLHGHAVLHAYGRLEGELLALTQLGRVELLVVLLQAEHAEGDVAGLVGHDVAQQLLQQWLGRHHVDEAE